LKNRDRSAGGLRAHWHVFVMQVPLQQAWLPIGPGGHEEPAAWQGAQMFAAGTHQSPEQQECGGMQP
jgi:hypothetical protein